MYILFAALILALCSLFCSAATSDLLLSVKGKPFAVIVVPADATEPEQTAASELASHLKQITGAGFPIVESAGQPLSGTRIFVGQTQTAKSMMPDLDFGKLGRDGIVIRRVGDDLILAGDRPRGTLYAVYTFLEDNVGCRWWAPDASYIPKKPTLRARVKDLAYTSPFICREAFYRNVLNRNPEFAVKLKLNGHHQGTIPPRMGGHYSILGWCHTFYHLIPPEKYFEAHPEWYSELDGKRTHTNAQLCLTNEEMRKELTKNALQWIKGNPTAGILSISQNDCAGQCMCAKCRAVVEAEGAESGGIITFVNEVAADIEKQYPDFLVETLAYYYTRIPPKHVKARPNVVVRFCSIDCDFSKPITAPTNAKFYADLKTWKEHASRLYVWDYLMNLENLLTLHPNWPYIGPTIRAFSRNNVTNLFEQGDGYNPDANFAVLRTWLIAHLMWNPNKDQNALIDQFLKGYYGPAAKHMREFIDLTCESMDKSGLRLPIFVRDYSSITPGDVSKAGAIFDAAESAVQGDEELLRRVRIQRASLDHVILLNSPAEGLPTGPELKQVLDRFLSVSDQTGNNFRQEGQVMSPEYREMLKAKVGP